MRHKFEGTVDDHELNFVFDGKRYGITSNGDVGEELIYLLEFLLGLKKRQDA